MIIKNSIGHKYALEKLNQFLNESPGFRYIDIDEWLTLNEWKEFIYSQLQKYCVIKDALWDVFKICEYKNINNFVIEVILPSEEFTLTVRNYNVQ